MNLKPLLIFPPLVLGVLGFMAMNQTGSPANSQKEAPRQAVRVLEVAKTPRILSAVGYGRVQAIKSWSAVSEVDGRVTGRLPDLAEGTVVAQGVELIRIDPTDYELAVAKSEANIAAAEATLAELESQEANSLRLLGTEQRIFEVAQAEFERVQTLFENGTTTAASLDTARKTLLNQENSLLNLTNTLELYPSQKASAEATLAVRKVELAEARRNLANTTVTAPFRGRVSTDVVQDGKFVRTGEDLVSLDAINAAEVVGSFQPRAFGSLMRGALGPRIGDLAEIDVTRVVSLMKSAGITAHVVLEFAGSDLRYPAELLRFRGTIDNETGTLGIVVRIDDPLIANTSDNRPPLEFGSFVSVVLESSGADAAIAVPRAALQQDDGGKPFVFTADAQDKLALSPVVPGPVTGGQVLILSGLEDGDRVLLSTPRPSVEGLALEVVTVDGSGQ